VAALQGGGHDRLCRHRLLGVLEHLDGRRQAAPPPRAEAATADKGPFSPGACGESGSRSAAASFPEAPRAL
jgi:hypothetical protein